MKIPNLSKNLGKMRHGMPQIQDEDKFLKSLKKDGIKYKESYIDSDKIIPTQKNFNEEKVYNIIKNKQVNKFYTFISNDFYVIDGHHRWLAAVNSGEPKTFCMVIDMDIDSTLKYLKDKKFVEKKSINECISFVIQELSEKQIRDYDNVSKDVNHRIGLLGGSLGFGAGAVNGALRAHRDSNGEIAPMIVSGFTNGALTGLGGYLVGRSVSGANREMKKQELIARDVKNYNPDVDR